MGQYIAMSVVQGGGGMPCQAGSVYHYMCTGKCTDVAIPLEEVPQGTLRFVLEKVCHYHLPCIFTITPMKYL